MKLGFSESQTSYISGSQTARALTESWIAGAMYCPNCGNDRLTQFPANLPVADFYCPRCNDQYEIKSQKKRFGNKIANGAYLTKLQRLNSDTSPNLILLTYNPQASEVENLIAIPKRYFVSSIVEERKPLAPTARRAGWIGSNILIGNIPESGKISLIRNRVVIPRNEVIAQWKKTAFLEKETLSARGWLVETMRCIESLDKPNFSLEEVYSFESQLQRLYPENNNVKPKIRQQLQFLRDNGYLDFVGNGQYRLRA